MSVKFEEARGQVIKMAERLAWLLCIH